MDWSAVVEVLEVLEDRTCFFLNRDSGRFRYHSFWRTERAPPLVSGEKLVWHRLIGRPGHQSLD